MTGGEAGLFSQAVRQCRSDCPLRSRPNDGLAVAACPRPWGASSQERDRSPSGLLNFDDYDYISIRYCRSCGVVADPGGLCYTPLALRARQVIAQGRPELCLRGQGLGKSLTILNRYSEDHKPGNGGKNWQPRHLSKAGWRRVTPRRCSNWPTATSSWMLWPPTSPLWRR